MSNEQAKRLTVDFSYRTPKFQFEGTWTGADVRVVSTHLRRAYLRHQQEMRRSQANTIAGTIPAKEVKNA